VSPGGIKVLGKPLNGTDMAFPNGMTYKALPDNEEHDITPVVNAQRYTFGIGAAKHELRLAHYCLLAGDTNRTDLGVGERVDLSFSAALVNNSAWTCTWSTAAGSVYPSSGNATTFIAPSNASPATVTATVGDEQVDVPFAVFEPSGIKASLRGLPDLFAIGSVGAGMYMNVVLQPTNVSFYRVQVKEPVADATNKQGYFVNHPPPNHDELHGAGAWHPVLCNNFVSDGVFDHADSYNWPIGQSGVYTWPIDAIWRIAADSVTHALSGWTPQVHTLSADGTVTVEKLGHHVTRSPNQPYGTAQ
jgi:hypothetical protein